MISYNKIILIIFSSKNLSRICVAGTDNGNTEDPDIEWLTPTTK